MSTIAFLSEPLEAVDRRVLAGLRFGDSLTGKTITDQLAVSGGPLTIRPNRSGVWIVFDTPTLSALTDDFLAEGVWPAPTPFQIQVKDRAGRYLSRQATIQIPAAISPITQPGSIFNPQSITLYAGPAATIGANWAALHVSVLDAATNQGLPNALVQATHTSDSVLLATGLTDSRGEALIGIPGLGARASDNGEGAVIETSTAVTVEVFFDPAVLNQPPGWLADPDQMLAHIHDPTVSTATQSAQLGSGSNQSFSFSISF